MKKLLVVMVVVGLMLGGGAVASMLAGWTPWGGLRTNLSADEISVERGRDIKQVAGTKSVSDLAAAWNPDEMHEEIVKVFVVEQLHKMLARYKTRISPEERANLVQTLMEESRNVGIDPLFLLAVIRVESAFSPSAISNKGARGLMQVMPATGEEVARKLGIDWTGPQQLHDTEINVRLGAHYLRRLLGRYAGSYRYALTAYNRGPTNLWRIVQAHGQLKPEYTEYFEKIQVTYESFLRKIQKTQHAWRS